MRVTKLSNGNKIISFGPMQSGKRTYTTTVYETPANYRLTVDTVQVGKQRESQTKTLTYKGNLIKEIVILFKDGVRDTVNRVK